MKVLFVCHANVCRSFMAQEILKKELPQAEVFSRGLYADPAVRVPDKIRRFLVQSGIAPRAHTPVLLSKEDAACADFIFLMERRHLDALADRWAEYSDKMWLLRDFVFGEDKDVPDPIGLSGRAFERNARCLLQTVHAAAAKLRQEL